MRRLLLILAALFALAPVRSADAEEPPGRFYSVIIGSNRAHRPEAAELRYAFSDAARMYRLLSALPGKAVLFGDPATAPASEDADVKADMRGIDLPAIRRTLQDFNVEMAAAREAGWRTHLVFFYSGHGDAEQGPDGRRSYLPLGGTRVFDESLLELLDESEAELKHLLLDACQGTGMARSGDGAKPEEVSEGFTRKGIAARPEIGVIAAATAEEKTIELSTLQGGILTHVIHSGLVGGADANGDEQVTYAELYRFAMTAGLAAGSGPHGLEVEVEPPHARFDTPLVDLTRAGRGSESQHSRLAVDPRQAGRYRVYVDDQLYAQWNSETRQPVQVLVPRGRHVEIQRCPACEDPSDTRQVRLSVGQSILSAAERVLLRWPRWELFGGRGQATASWPLFPTGYGKKISPALALPEKDIKRREAPKSQPGPDRRPVVFVVGLNAAEGKASGRRSARQAKAQQAKNDELRELASTATMVLNNRLGSAMDKRWWDVRYFTDIESSIEVERARQAMGCEDESCMLEIGDALGVKYDYIVGGKLDRVDAQVLYDVKIIHARELRRLGWHGGRAEATKSSLMAAMDAAIPALLVDVPHTRTRVGVVPEPQPLLPPATVEIDDGWQPEGYESASDGSGALWGSAALLVAGAAAGGASLWAFGARDDAAADVQRNPLDAGARDEHANMHRLGAGAAVGAGLLGATGLSWLLWELVGPSGRAAEGSFTPAPVVVPTTGGVRAGAVVRF